jgi:transposase-like protein
MPKSTGSRYTKEFKAEAVQLARFSPERSIRQLAYTSLASPSRLYATGSGTDRPRRARGPFHRRA